MESFPLKPKAIRRFYEPLILLKSLSETCDDGQSGRIQEQLDESRNLHRTEEEEFQRFVYKIAYICAHGRGDTVTSFAVLENPEKFVLIFAANQISFAQGQRIVKYIGGLLRAVARSDWKSEQRVRRDILKAVLLFNRSRVEFHLRDFVKNAAECLKDSRKRQNVQETATLTEALRKCLSSQILQIAPEVFRDVSDDDLFQFSLKYLEEINKLGACDLKACKGFSCCDSTMRSQSAKSWSEFLHCISRLKAYEQAVDELFKAEHKWPDLFRHFEIRHIPSSKPEANPLGRKSASADNVIGRMTNDKSKMAEFRALALDMRRKYDIDDRIQRQSNNPKFKPVVHSEILLYDWIAHGGAKGLTFFKGWEYIGSSKPTCWLCHCYLMATRSKIRYRPTHGNIYHNWRFPDAYSVKSTNQRQDILNQVIEKIRDEAFRILSEKCSIGKKHDSNTYSGWSQRESEAVVTILVESKLEFEDLGVMIDKGLTMAVSSGEDEDDEYGGVSLS